MKKIRVGQVWLRKSDNREYRVDKRSGSVWVLLHVYGRHKHLAKKIEEFDFDIVEDFTFVSCPYEHLLRSLLATGLTMTFFALAVYFLRGEAVHLERFIR